MSESNEQQSTSEAAQQPDTSAPVAASQTQIDQSPKAPVEATDTNPSASQTQKETLDAIRKGERIALIIAAIVAFGTLGQWATSWVNNSSASDQTDKLISASQRSERAAAKIADASKRNAAAAESFATNAGNINTAMGKAVDKLNLQAGALADSAQQASRLAADTEKSYTHSVHADRAWIGLQNLNLVQFGMDQTLKFTFDIANSGRTPALNVRYAVSGVNDPIGNLYFPDWTQKRIEDWIAKQGTLTTWDFTYVQVIVPQTATPIVFESPTPIGPMTYKMVARDSGHFFVLGRIEYDDVLGGPQSEDFCFQIFNKRLGLHTVPDFGWRYCPSGNKMSYDKNQ